MNKCLVIMLCMLLGSCRQSGIQGEAEFFCNLDTLGTASTLYKSSLYESVRLIRLDADEVLLSDVVKLQECEGFLYALDRMNQLYMFTSSGKFVRLIGGKGEGPGEYREISDFVVVPDLGHIYLLESKVQAVYVYDMLTGRFVNSMLLDSSDYFSRHIAYDAGFLYTDLYAKGTGRFILRRLGRNREEPDCFYLDAEVCNSGWKRARGTSPFFQSEHGGFFFVPEFSAVVYQVSNGEVMPYLELYSNDFMDRKVLDRVSEKGFQELVFSNRIYGLNDCVFHSRFVSCCYLQGNIKTYLYGRDATDLRKVSLLIDDVLFRKEQDVFLPMIYGTTDFLGDYFYLNSSEIAQLRQLLAPDILSSDYQDVFTQSSFSDEMNPVVLYYKYR